MILEKEKASSKEIQGIVDSGYTGIKKLEGTKSIALKTMQRPAAPKGGKTDKSKIFLQNEY